MIAFPEWYEAAVCAQVGSDYWYPEKGFGSKDAKKICATCPVSGLCLEYALENAEKFGVWGGKTERERRKLGNRRRCRNCNDPITEANPAERYCSDDCRRIARRQSQDECEKAYACIQCGIPATTLRCPVCTKRHQSDQTMTRAQTKAAA